jgi:hypothetical protein
MYSSSILGVYTNIYERRSFSSSQGQWMRHVYRNNTLETKAKRRGIQVVQSIKNIEKCPSRGKRSGKWKNIRRKKSLHISAKILATITIIETSMATLTKFVGNCIESLT